MTIRNEGHATADDVDIYINTKGQIENAMGQIGVIKGKIEEQRLFEEYVSFSSNISYFYANLHHLHCGMIYRLCLIVSEQKNDKSQEDYILKYIEMDKHMKGNRVVFYLLSLVLV